MTSGGTLSEEGRAAYGRFITYDEHTKTFVPHFDAITAHLHTLGLFILATIRECTAEEAHLTCVEHIDVV